MKLYHKKRKEKEKRCTVCVVYINVIDRIKEIKGSVRKYAG